MRRGMHDLVADHPGWEIVAEARTGRQAIEVARHARPEVMVLELSLPELSGFDAIRQARLELPATQICVFSAYEDDAMVMDAFATGARAYVTKSEPGERLLSAIEALERGEPYLSPRATEAVVRGLVHSRAGSPGVGSLDGPLTTREREIAQLFVQGLSARALASRLGITIKTVDTHRAAIMRKLGLRTMADLVRYAIRNRLLQP